MSCVWDGPKSLKSTPRLKDFYAEQHDFFCQILGVESADLSTFISEATRFEPWHDLKYIGDIFMAINACLERSQFVLSSNEVKQTMGKLINCKAFPIRRADSTGYDELCSAAPTQHWFIADLWHLQESFQGHLPLLALDMEIIEKLDELFKHPSLNSRLLSTQASGTTKVEGSKVMDPAYTMLMKRKARYIARYGCRFVTQNHTNVATA